MIPFGLVQETPQAASPIQACTRLSEEPVLSNTQYIRYRAVSADFARTKLHSKSRLIQTSHRPPYAITRCRSIHQFEQSWFPSCKKVKRWRLNSQGRKKNSSSLVRQPPLSYWGTQLKEQPPELNPCLIHHSSVPGKQRDASMPIPWTRKPGDTRWPSRQTEDGTLLYRNEDLSAFM